LKFYDCKTAPSPRRVRIFLAEKGVELETEEVDLAAGQHLTDEFAAINPDRVVPVLQLDDGSYLSEVVAICQYLEELYPEPALLGSSPEERARVSMWNAKVEQLGLIAAMEALRNYSKGFRGRAIAGARNYEQIPELAERGRQRIFDFFERLDAHLANNACLAGENYSMADITALVFVDFAKWVKAGIPEECANLRRWYDDVSQRPAAAV
jgi:glutathione S-transferase